MTLVFNIDCHKGMDRSTVIVMGDQCETIDILYNGKSSNAEVSGF
jgi:hypothetical protein